MWMNDKIFLALANGDEVSFGVGNFVLVILGFTVESITRKSTRTEKRHGKFDFKETWNFCDRLKNR